MDINIRAIIIVAYREEIAMVTAVISTSMELEIVQEKMAFQVLKIIYKILITMA